MKGGRSSPFFLPRCLNEMHGAGGTDKSISGNCWQTNSTRMPGMPTCAAIAGNYGCAAFGNEVFYVV